MSLRALDLLAGAAFAAPFSLRYTVGSPGEPWVSLLFAAGFILLALSMWRGRRERSEVLGIAPGTFAFAWLGSSLGGVIDARAADCAAKALSPCPYSADLLALLTPQMQIAIGLLGLLALAPVVIKHIRARPNV